MTSGDPLDELVPENTNGYNPTAKKTLDEYKNLDANDESLRKWKESLGLSTASSQLGDGKAQVVILSLSLEFENHPEIFIDLTNPNTLEDIKKKPIVLKAGESYVLKIRFKVLNDIVCGLKFLQVYKRAGFSSGTISEMIGSYSPSDEVYEKRFPKEVVPSHRFTRGKYTAYCKFTDDDKVIDIRFSWMMEIKKDW